jgi:hypothetical protein
MSYQIYGNGFGIRPVIGKSPKNKMTRFSRSWGEEYDGNSILVKLTEPHSYVYIGSIIYSFRAKDELVSYVSPVSSNDIPYPYAIDRRGHFYLMESGGYQVVVLKKMKLANGDSPYWTYWDKKNIEDVLNADDITRPTTC